MHLIERRRAARMELAKKILSEAEACQLRQAEAGYRAVWYDWIEKRHHLRQSMISEANAKKRKLDREKRGIERPRAGTCSPWSL